MKHFSSFGLRKQLFFVVGLLLATSCEKDSENEADNKSMLYCTDAIHPHMIDLGLPSGTKWACCNLGALTPEEFGGCYAWGEINEKTVHEKYNYQFRNNQKNGKEYIDIGLDIAGTSFDAAKYNWGISWHMPTLEQYQELMNNCHFEWTSQNGVSGCKFTGVNGGSIFLPAAEFSSKEGRINSPYREGYYWSSTFNNEFEKGWCSYAFHFFYEGRCEIYFGERAYGFSIRPVCN